MNDFISLLAPAIVVGFALQQLIEILDPLLNNALKWNKKWLLSIASFLVGLLLTLLLDIRLLRSFGVARMPLLDALLSALVITGITKGSNDLIKLIGYKKEESKLALKKRKAAKV